METLVGSFATPTPLPFRPGEGAAPAPPPTAQPRPAELTQTVEGVLSPFAPDAAVPFRAAPPAPRTRLTMEQFASLVAELAVNPSAAPQTRARYGLDEASHRADAEEWHRRLGADAQLYARYHGLFQSFRNWLSRPAR
jgi:hypothetical protein